MANPPQFSAEYRDDQQRRRLKAALALTDQSARQWFWEVADALIAARLGTPDAERPALVEGAGGNEEESENGVS